MLKYSRVLPAHMEKCRSLESGGRRRHPREDRFSEDPLGPSIPRSYIAKDDQYHPTGDDGRKAKPTRIDATSFGRCMLS